LQKKVLSQAELNIETAENGVMALFKFEHENNFDFILMDLQMPEMDGYEATVKIREKNKTIPIIALTGEAMFDVQQKVVEAGMNDFISKPFTPENLFAKILKYF
jgi:CheY-like chemotaxis protein